MGISFSVHLDFSSQLVFLTKLIVCAWPHPRGYLNTEDLIHFASSYSLWTWYLQNCCTILEVGERSHYLLIYIFNWPFPVRCETTHKLLNAFLVETRNQWQAEDIQLVVWCVPWCRPWKQLSVSLTFWQPQQKSSSEPRDFRLVQYTK